MNNYIAQFGSYKIPMTDFVITSEINKMPIAEIKVKKNDWLQEDPKNLLEEVIVYRVKKYRKMFTGNITTVSEEDEFIVVRLEGGIEFSDTHMSGLQTRIPTPDLLYAMCRMSGLPDDRINIQGYDPSVKKYVAFISINGIKLTHKVKYGKFTLMSTNDLKTKIPTDDAKELWELLLKADGILSFELDGSNFYDVETIAIEQADAFLTYYSLLLQYPYSKFKDELNLWERKKLHLHLRRGGALLLVNLPKGYTWLHGLDDYLPSQEHELPNISFDYEQGIKQLDTILKPLIIWNRFRNSNDFLLVTVGFWQVVELLCVDIKFPKRFKKEEIKDIEEKIEKVLNGREAESIQIALGKVNQRTLDDKIQKYLEAKKIYLTIEDIEILAKFRKIRNGIEHGSSYAEPTNLEVVRLKSILNYILTNSYAING